MLQDIEDELLECLSVSSIDFEDLISLNMERLSAHIPNPDFVLDSDISFDERPETESVLPKAHPQTKAHLQTSNPLYSSSGLKKVEEGHAASEMSMLVTRLSMQENEDYLRLKMECELLRSQVRKMERDKIDVISRHSQRIAQLEQLIAAKERENVASMEQLRGQALFQKHQTKLVAGAPPPTKKRALVDEWLGSMQTSTLAAAPRISTGCMTTDGATSITRPALSV